VPSDQAVDLPEGVGFVQGACLGIPGIRAHRAVFGDGPVEGRTVLVRGGLGAVSGAAIALARRGGAQVLATVRAESEVALAAGTRADHVLVQSAPDFVRQFSSGRRAVGSTASSRWPSMPTFAPTAMSSPWAGPIAAYSTLQADPAIPFWPLLFKNVTVRLLGSDDFPLDAKLAAARDITAVASELEFPIAGRFPLEDIVQAHLALEAPSRGSPGRVVLDIG